jgi:hypothetical protein
MVFFKIFLLLFLSVRILLENGHVLIKKSLKREEVTC